MTPPTPAKKTIPVFDMQFTQAVCDVLAQTGTPGLTGSELLAALDAVNIAGLDDGPNKRTQLRSTLHNAQVRRRSGGTLVAFVNAAMNPALYVRDPIRWEQLRDQINAPMSMYGFCVNDDGKFAKGGQSATFREAATLASELVTELRRRGCHEVVLAYCTDELIRRSEFHAVSEAAKSIPDRLRRHTGLGTDGADLYSQVFATKSGTPLVRINAFADASDISEHRGFANLLTGIHGHYRNPRAHRPRLGSLEDHSDLYDAFAMFSYVHRRLDDAGVHD